MSSHHQVRAAGTIPWRIQHGSLQVALVHRPTYDDWAWAKGKLEQGEAAQVAATRETWEETGLRVRLGRPLPRAEYEADGAGKRVDYWAAEVIGGAGRLVNEIDDVRWLSPAQAADTLSYPRDRAQLDELVSRHEDGMLDTVPLLFVRHALAVPRKGWKKHDQKRPLAPEGVLQAKALAPLMESYGVRRLVSSSSERCATTFRWASKRIKTPVRLSDQLTEEGFAAKPRSGIRDLDELVSWGGSKGRGMALCTHGPTIAPLLEHLAEDSEGPIGRQLERIADEGMDKGEVLVMHLLVSRKSCRIVDIERHCL